MKCIIDFKDMLDGVFNPPAKGANDDLDTDEEEDEPETNPSEKNMEIEEVVNTLTDDVVKTITEGDHTSVTNNTNNENCTITEENVNTQNETNDITVIATQVTVVSPSASNMPTTFGSENRTSHRFLRKSLNLSRNNSIDSSNGTPGNEQQARPNKIRIEARIDSDKKTKNPQKVSKTTNSKSGRSLRYNMRNKNQTDDNESEKDVEPSQPKPREPEIIEKILHSPTKMKTPSKSQTHTPEKQTDNNTEKATEEKCPSKNSKLRNENRNEDNESICEKSFASSEEVININLLIQYK